MDMIHFCDTLLSTLNAITLRVKANVKELNAGKGELTWIYS
jgi:hypothetical protein